MNNQFAIKIIMLKINYSSMKFSDAKCLKNNVLTSFHKSIENDVIMINQSLMI